MTPPLLQREKCVSVIKQQQKKAEWRLVLDSRTSSSGFLLNPDFYETQPQKPHNKLKKAQMTLREKRLRPELKLGGESDNPTSKGIP